MSDNSSPARPEPQKENVKTDNSTSTHHVSGGVDIGGGSVGDVTLNDNRTTITVHNLMPDSSNIPVSKDNSTTTSAKQSRAEARKYCNRLLAMGEFTYLKLLATNKQLPIDSAYIKLRVHEKQDISFKDPDYSTANTPNEQYLRDQTRLLERSSKAYEPSEAIEKHPHAVIVGDPGAGKTTLMRFLARQSASRKLKDCKLPDLPIYLPISKLTAKEIPDDDLMTFLPDFVKREYRLDNAKEFLNKAFDEGKALLLLDGLDEAGAISITEGPNFYQRTVELIRRFHQHYPKTPIVVTCRKAGWAGGLDGFQVFDVLDFSWESIQEFIHVWFCAMPGANEEGQRKETKLVAALKDNVRMRFLAANPMLLSLICGVFERDLELPERRARLYEECTKWLLTQWDSSRGLDRRSRFPSDRKADLLNELALHFQQKRQRYFEKKELLERIRAFLPQINLEVDQAEAVLQELMANHGLLEEEGVGWYGFPHLTLQEYFCARALREENNLEPILYHLGDPWWEEVTLLYAGSGDAAPLLKELLTRKDDLFHTNLFLATRCLAGSPKISDTVLRSEILNRTWEIAKKKQLPLRERELASSSLFDTGEKTIRQQLLDQFLSKDSLYFILDLMFPVLTKEQLQQLISSFGDSRIPLIIQRFIGISLTKIGDSTVVPQLLGLLIRSDVHVSIKSEIAGSLSKLGDPTTVPELLQMLLNPDLDLRIKSRIAFSLNSLSQGTIVLQLFDLLTETDLDMKVRSGIIYSLGLLNEHTIVPQLLDLLTDPDLDVSVKSEIAGSLGRISSRAIVPQLVKLLTDPALDVSVRSEIAGSLGRLGSRAIVPQLVKLLTDPTLDVSVKSRIAESLGGLRDRTIVPQLVKLLTDSDLGVNVKGEIALSLISLGNRRIVPQLLKMLVEPELDEFVKLKIVIHLGRLSNRRIIPQLLKMLVEPEFDDFIRDRIIDSLKQLGINDVKIIKLLTKTKSNHDLSVTLYTALEEASQKLKVRLYRDDSTSPPKFYTEPLPD